MAGRRVTVPPMVVHCCHCLSCQRETGSAFALNAVVESSKIERLPALDEPLNPVPCPDVVIVEHSGGETGATTRTERGALKEAAKLSPPMTTTATMATSPTNAEVAPTWDVTLPSLSGHGHPVVRCGRCGTAVWSYYSSGPLLSFVSVGTLDKAWAIDPDVHIFAHSKRAFVKLPFPGTGSADEEREVPVYDQFYTDKEAFWRPESLAVTRPCCLRL